MLQRLHYINQWLLCANPIRIPFLIKKNSKRWSTYIMLLRKYAHTCAMWVELPWTCSREDGTGQVVDIRVLVVVDFRTQFLLEKLVNLSLNILFSFLFWLHFYTRFLFWVNAKKISTCILSVIVCIASCMYIERVV